MGTEVDVILTAAAFVVGVMMLTGKGDIFFKDRHSKSINTMYDMKKVQRGFGVVLLIMGAATGISMFLKNPVMDIAYVFIILLAFIGGVIYMKKYCRK